MASEWSSEVWPDWCPGCGNFGILSALKLALSELDLDRRNFVIVSGIGCSGKIAHFVRANGVHTLHGRAIPFASGIKIANPELKLIVHGGDGDLLGIGMGHFIALGRRNIDVLVVIHNNGVYGLTKGQASPTLGKGLKTKSLASPNITDPVNPILLGMMAGYTFLARGYAYNVEHLKSLLKTGLNHKGAGVIEVIQPCPTWNNVKTPEWVSNNTLYLKEWDPLVNKKGDLAQKMREIISLEYGDKIPLGIILEDNTKETYQERITGLNKFYSESPPAKQKIESKGNPLPINLEKTFGRYLI
ncbi:MAG: 2-oxoacid:ferredoxin oxidoreductase subunit beta [Candidatus Methanomethyliales bacterium]|nr:2-oxoacid:ferredoxin oxidoreductase subunit beta [Candidatus Methanomethylicales archaeon]